MAKPPRITPAQLRASAHASLQDAASQQDVDRALLALGIWWRGRPDGRLHKLWRTAVDTLGGAFSPDNLVTRPYPPNEHCWEAVADFLAAAKEET